VPQLTEEQFLEITNSHNPKKFSNIIEKIVVDDGIRYVDAIMEYCEDKDIDIDIVPKLLTQSLRDKIHAEALDYNFFPKIGQLPI
tara:strand:+ start:1337 stop:1591 length:255 start_codon:yes stop_codon:yes gene_type:complete